MEVFLLLLILIVILGALGWLPGVIRVVLILCVAVGGVFALVMWWGSTLPPKEDHYDAYFKQLNDKIYSETEDKRHAHGGRR